jgi:hypothetical protein
MPLADVLSAVRRLLLDEQRPDGAPSQRRQQLRDRFPALTAAEVDDLAAISPERMRVYSRLIFNGELNMLRWIFPVSLAAIASVARATGDQRDGRDVQGDLVRDLHRKCPWRSVSSRLLADNFEAYIREYRRDLTDAWAGLGDLVAYERIDLQVFYANDFGRPISPDEFTDLSVGDLLAVQVARPPYVTLRRFEIDVISLASQWRDNRQFPNPPPTEAPVTATCAREPSSLMPKWLMLTTASEAALRAAAPAQITTVEQLAAAYVQAAPAAFESEQAAFADFHRQLSAWFALGIFHWPP